MVIGDPASDSGRRQCGTQFCGKYPTNLKSHLKKCHSTEFQQMTEKEMTRKEAAASGGKTTRGQPTITQSLGMSKPYDRNSPKSLKITRKLAVFVGIGHVANRIVECEEFRELLAELDPRYVVPGRAGIDVEMTKVLSDLKGRVAAKIRDARKVSLCADIWTKKGLTEAFVGITAHFFTRTDHKRRVATLAVRTIQSPHTADRIEEVVRQVLEEWDIPQEKVRAILTDNGSNITAAFRDWLHKTKEVEGESEEEEEEESPSAETAAASPTGQSADTDSASDVEETPLSDVEQDIEEYDQQELSFEIAFSLHKRLSCFSHTLQLVVNKFDTLTSPKQVLRSAHSIVRKFNKSVKATEKLVKLCGKKLLSTCPTRWNSTFLMISRMLEVHSSLAMVLQELNWDDLSNRDWKILENLYELLHPFARYTALTGAEETTTIAMVLPVLLELKCHLEEVRNVCT